MNNIYLASKLICDTYEKQVQKVTAEIETWLTHKLKHTFQVTHEIMDILYQEKDVYNAFSASDKELVELAALLHDLGRFYQHNKKQIFPSTQFEHGAAGVGVLKENPVFNNPIVLFAIAEHNHYEINYGNSLYQNLDREDKKKAEIIAKMVRDADKLDNIRHTIYTGDIYIPYNCPQGNLSEEVKTYLRNHQPINYHECLKGKQTTSLNAAERFVLYLSWVNDINFEHTKSVIRNLGFVKFGLDHIQKMGVPKEDVSFLEKYLKI